MPRVSDEHRQLMTLRIEQAAMECARRKGFAALSMSDIISESGLSAGAIYGYYKGKDDLLAALARRVVGGRAALLDELASRNPVPHPAEGLQEFMVTATGPLRDGGLVIQIWGMAANSEAISAITVGAYGRLSEHLESYLAAWYRDSRGLSADAAKDAASIILPAVLALMQGWMFRVSVAGTANDEQYLAAVAAMLGHL